MSFGPADQREAEIFALEELRADIQYEITKAMHDIDLSQKELAERLGFSPAWISQLLGDDANLTLESISRVFLALGKTCKVKAEGLPQHYNEAVADLVGWPSAEWDEVSQIPTSQKDRTSTVTLLLAITSDVGNRASYEEILTNDNFAEWLNPEMALA